MYDEQADLALRVEDTERPRRDEMKRNRYIGLPRLQQHMRPQCLATRRVPSEPCRRVLARFKNIPELLVLLDLVAKQIV